MLPNETVHNGEFLKLFQKGHCPIHYIPKEAFIYDVRRFLGIFDLPTYPHQILYYISLFSKIR